jgi:hypothetical protein
VDWNPLVFQSRHELILVTERIRDVVLELLGVPKAGSFADKTLGAADPEAFD